MDAEEAEFMRRLAPKVSDYLPVIEGETFDQYATRAAQEPVLGRRALIAAAVVELSKEYRREAQGRKNAWIAVARIQFSPTDRKECFVCGKFKSITQAHHVVPLAAQFDRGFDEPDHEHVWLCPNHHVIVHLLLPQGDEDPQKLGRRATAPVGDLSVEEIRTMLDLIGRSGRGKE